MADLGALTCSCFDQKTGGTAIDERLHFKETFDDRLDAPLFAAACGRAGVEIEIRDLQGMAALDLFAEGGAAFF